MQYRFRLLLADRTEQGDCFMHVESDAEACMIADALLAESTSATIEVSRRGGTIYSAGQQS